MLGGARVRNLLLTRGTSALEAMTTKAGRAVLAGSGMFEAKLKIRQTDQMETEVGIAGFCGRLRAKVCPGVPGGIATPQEVSLESVDLACYFFDDDILYARGEGGSKEQCAIDRRQRPCSIGNSDASFRRRNVSTSVAAKQQPTHKAKPIKPRPWIFNTDPRHGRLRTEETQRSLNRQRTTGPREHRGPALSQR